VWGVRLFKRLRGSLQTCQSSECIGSRVDTPRCVPSAKIYLPAWCATLKFCGFWVLVWKILAISLFLNDNKAFPEGEGHNNTECIKKFAFARGDWAVKIVFPVCCRLSRRRLHYPIWLTQLANSRFDWIPSASQKMECASEIELTLSSRRQRRVCVDIGFIQQPFSLYVFDDANADCAHRQQITRQSRLFCTFRPPPPAHTPHHVYTKPVAAAKLFAAAN